MSGEKINKTESVSFDPNIVPAETAARMEREGEDFKSTSPGQTVDSEGIANIHAVVPEPYAEGSEKDKS